MSEKEANGRGLWACILSQRHGDHSFIDLLSRRKSADDDSGRGESQGITRRGEREGSRGSIVDEPRGRNTSICGCSSSVRLAFARLGLGWTVLR